MKHFPSLDAGRSLVGRTVTFDIDDGSKVTGDVLDVVLNRFAGASFVLGSFGNPDAVGGYTLVPFDRVVDYRFDGSFAGGYYIGVD